MLLLAKVQLVVSLTTYILVMVGGREGEREDAGVGTSMHIHWCIGA